MLGAEGEGGWRRCSYVTGMGQHECLQTPPAAAHIFIFKSFYWSTVASQHCVSVLLYSKVNTRVCVCLCVCTCMLSCFSRVQLFVTLWTVALQAPLSTGCSRQEYWSGLPCLLQGIFSTQGSNVHVQQHLHCRWILYRQATREVKVYNCPLFFGFPVHLGHHRALRGVPWVTW